MWWPAARLITVFDLLSSRAGYGFASDFSLPAVHRLCAVQKGGREPQSFPGPDVWMAELAQVPVRDPPGQAWLYDTCSALQGVLIARVSGPPLPDVLAEQVFAPLGMSDTGFEVPGGTRGRFTSCYRASPGRWAGAGRRARRAVAHPASVPAGQWRAGRNRR